MQASRGCGVEDSSYTRIPRVSPTRANMRILRVLSFAFESIVQQFPVESPASFMPAAVPEPQLHSKERVPKSDQGA